MSKMYDLRDELLALSDADRANLLAMIEREEVTRPYKASRADLAVWSALVRHSPHSIHRSLDAFLKDKHGGLPRQTWSSAVTLLCEFADDVDAVRHSDEDRAALIELAVRCLASDMRIRGEPVNPKTLVTNIERIYPAIDRAFPGYIEAGLLHMLIRLTPEVAAE